jgi:rubrerythrin
MMLPPCSARLRKAKPATPTAILNTSKNAVIPATGEPIGDTVLNLKASIAGETHEYTDMYPGMAKTARDEGFDEIADWFETLAKAEKSHAGKFQKTLDALDANLASPRVM